MTWYIALGLAAFLIIWCFWWRGIKISNGDSIDRYYLLNLFGFGVFLHCIHHSDPEGVYHNHPWTCLSFIFGRYGEYTAEPQWDGHRLTGITATGHMRRMFNYLPAKRHHRVVLVDDNPVWTLVFHFRKSNTWSVIDSKGRVVDAPWEGAGTGRSYTAALNVREQPPSDSEIKALAGKLEASGFTPRNTIMVDVPAITISRGNRVLDGNKRVSDAIKRHLTTIKARYVGTSEEFDIEISKLRLRKQLA